MIKRPLGSLDRWRRVLVLAGFGFCAFGLLARATYLQVVHNDHLQREGAARYLRDVTVPAHRGKVFDRNGEPLAISTPVDALWADPKVLLQNVSRLPELANVLGTESERLESRLRQRAGRSFVYLQRQTQPATAARALALAVPGIHSRREYARYYPAAEVTGHLLGYTDIDDVGQEGLELAYESWLRGQPGSKRVLRDMYGHTVKDVANVRVPVPGQDLFLSIDARLQYLTYRALKTAVLRRRAKAATAVVLDVDTGEVLAMANQPAGNPNNRAARKASVQRNRALTDLFEPGSTLKPFTVIAALDTALVNGDTVIDTRPGYLRVGRSAVRDDHDYGLLTVAGIIRKSSNVGVSKLALGLPEGELWRLYSKLGFGDSTASAFPGEAPGYLSHYSTWNRFELATHSFGYGLSVTALQLARAYLAIASDGILREPSLVKIGQAASGERVMSAVSTRAVRAMMQAVVAEGGTAPRAQVPGYTVAGKTGTVKKNASGGGYEEDRFLALFAGMVPATKPRLVMVVMIDDPRGEEYYGGLVAAPVFAKVMTAAMRLLDVAPDDLRLDEVQAPVPATAGGAA